MRVLVLTPWYPTDTNPTQGLFIEQQVRALSEAGCEVTVVSPRPRWLPVPGREKRQWRQRLPRRSQVGGREVWLPRYWLFPLGLGWPTAGSRAWLAMRRLVLGLHARINFDVVHGHELLPVGLAASSLKKELDLPIVLTLHGEDPFFTTRSGTTEYNRLRDTLWASIDHVGVVGRPLLKYAGTLGCPGERVSVIPNGVEVHPTPPVSAGYHDVAGNGRLVLSVSNLHQSKGIDLNLRALRALVDEGLSDLHYVVIGEGPDRAAFERLTERLGLRDRVTFLGRLPREETISWMKACDLFSLPSWQEAFGIVYLEAMAQGKPVIGCRGQGAEDIVTHGVNGLLVEPHDVVGLATAMWRLLMEPSLAEALGRAGAERAGEFSWARNAQGYGQLYATVTERAAQRRTT